MGTFILKLPTANVPGAIQKTPIKSAEKRKAAAKVNNFYKL